MCKNNTMSNKVKCLFGYHRYDEKCYIYPTLMYVSINISDWQHVRAGVCSNCRQSMKLVNYTLFGCHVFKILEETNDQLIVTISGLKPIYLKKMR